MQNDSCLIKEIKKMSDPMTKPSLPEAVDGCTGEGAIVEKFKEVYMMMYNKNAAEDEVFKISDQVEKLIAHNDAATVSLIDGKVVKNAARFMKKNKGDISGGFKSNALKSGPDILFWKIVDIFKGWINHGYVTKMSLAVSLLPLIKGLTNSASTDNYQLIADTSLLLKLFEKVILILWGPGIQNDDLQFGFRERTGTTQCT